MKQINDFISRFDTSLRLDESLIVERQNRFYLLNQNLKKLISEGFFYAGIYLGKMKHEVFFPSFNLLALIGDRKKANKTIVDEKAEWLFICGRDLFKRGIIKVTGSKETGDYTLVLNKHGECLGFGEILHNIDETKNKKKVVIKNISDIGDFLRRENRATENFIVEQSWRRSNRKNT
jgi:ribosome biogenesis protein Nip4